MKNAAVAGSGVSPPESERKKVICSTCNKDARDHAVAYYTVEIHDLGMDFLIRHVVKCWPCLSTSEKLARDQTLKDPRRFKIAKTIKGAV